MNLHYIIAIIVSLLVAACGGGDGSSTTSPTITSSEIFPTGLMVSSPFDFVDESLTPRGMDSRYEWATGNIDNALNGSLPVRFAVKYYHFFENVPTHADCFGPKVNYENHPHDSGPNTGQISGGDLGIWQETEASSGHACIAEELNAQLLLLSEQVHGGLKIMASMIYMVDSSARLTLPSAGSSLTITTELGSSIDPIDASAISFNNASITHNVDGSWTYQINFDVIWTWVGSGAFTHNVFMKLDHNPSTTDPGNQYDGLLTLRISGSSGNTHFPGDNCPDTENRTYNASVKYERNSATKIKLQARSATFCGTDVNGHIVSTGADNGMVDDDLPYNGSNNGWSENFSIFAAEFDPTSLAGKYSYIWQAGPDDSNSRIFTIGVSEANSTLVGESYFGFGNPIATTDGNIQIFVCNLSGPDGGLSLAERTYIDRLQRQHFTLDTRTGIFEPTSSGASNIVYAPTNDCDYDGSAPNGEFLYDTDGDGLTSDETHQAVTNDLWKGTVQNQTDGDTLPEIVTMRGFTISTPPGDWPSEN